ncbi:MAG: ROK family protein [Bacteroidetes bacterium]|nr:ROK family protein [Bacteroidota bacterium]MCL2302187.1 ROK family protein [Lentimicrobiaceae bacterium]
MYSKDRRIVVTLDAGGINFDFSAIQGNEIIVEPITKPSNAAYLDLCMNTLVEGFSQIMAQLKEKPVAISFAFPGPADYPNGVIGGFLPNFPSFRDGVALGPFLAEKFGIPVYINNDADLFVYGEALAGALPEINARLKKAGSDKVYRNLIGFTWGTGFGFGLTVNGNMHIGDNSCCEVYCLPDKNHPDIIVEDSVSVRAIKRVYGEKSGNPDHGLEPFDIFNIAEGVKIGDREAAKAAFSELGKAAGEIIANAATLIDGIVVIGGGLTKAHKYIMPSLFHVMRSEMHTLKGETLNRLQFKVYDLDNEHEFLEFAKGDSKKIKVYGSDKTVTYDPQKRIGVTISKLGALKAVALGAYAFALHEIDGF